MLFTGRKIILTATIATVLMVALIAKFRAYAAPQGGAIKLEGAWVVKVKTWTIPGVSPLPAQWSGVLSANDPSGRSAAFHGSVDVGFPSSTPFPPGVFTTPILGEFVMTGPNTAVFNSVWYLVQIGNPGHIVQIGTDVGTVTFTAPNKTEETDHFKFYSPAADADGDGFPDPDAPPQSLLLSFDATSVGTRVPAP